MSDDSGYVWSAATDREGLTGIPDGTPEADRYGRADPLFSVEVDGVEFDPHAVQRIDGDRGGVWNSLVTGTTRITSEGTGVEDATVLEAHQIQADRSGAEDALLGAIHLVNADRDGLVGTDATSIGDVTAGDRVMVDSTAGVIGSATAGETLLLRSEVDGAQHLYSEGDGLIDSSAEYIDALKTEAHGIVNSEIDQVNRLVSGDAAVTGSRIGEARFIGGERGLLYSTADSIGQISAGAAGLYESEVGEVEVIHAQQEAGRNAVVDRVGQVVSDDWEIDAEGSRDSRGFKDSEIGELGSINVYQDAVVRSEVDELGDVTAAHNGIVDSEIGRITGDLDVENQPIQDSVVGLVEGDITTDTAAIIGSEVTAVLGDIEAEHVFRGSEFSAALSDSIRAERIGYLSTDTNIAVARELRTDDTGNQLTITPYGDGGDLEVDAIDPILDSLRSDATAGRADGMTDETEVPTKLRALQLYGDQLEDGEWASDELLDRISDLEDHVPDLGDGLQDAYDTIQTFSGMDPGLIEELLVAADSEFEEYKHERVEEFGHALSMVADRYTEELVDVLRAGDHPGKDLFDIGRSQEFGEFASDPAGAIETVVSGRLSFEYETAPDLDDSPYREDLIAALDRIDDDRLEHLQYLADETDTEIELDVEQTVRNWEYQRRNTDHERDIDRDELRKMIDSEIASKRRAYLKDALTDIGKEDAIEQYEEIADRDVEDLDGAAATLMRAHEGYFWNREAAEALMQEGDAIYRTAANQAWVEASELDYDDLEGPGELVYETNLEAQAAGDQLLDDDVMVAAMRDELGIDPDALGDDPGIGDIADALADQDGDLTPEEYGQAHQEGLEAGLEDDYEPPAGGADEITVRVAEPMEQVRMAEYFNNSCFKVGKVRGWSPIGTAVDANKHVIYAEQDGQVIGRKQVAFTEDDELATYSTYSNVEGPVGELLDDYAEQWADEIGTDVVEHDKDVAVLEAERWHDRVL